MTPTYTPKLIPVNSPHDAQKALDFIGCDPQSISIMAPKMLTRIIQLNDIPVQDAVIMKQDMLSAGGDCALPKNAFKLTDETATILVFGTIRQLHDFVEKLRRHYPRLQRIADEIETVLHQQPKR